MFHPRGPTFWELACQALSSTERGYDLLANKFEYTPFRTPDFLLNAVPPLIATGQPPRSALDVCCGTGAAMRMLRPLCRERVAGIDFSGGMLDEARQLTATAAGTARLEFVCQDVLSMSFQNEFDVAVCFGALGHILPRDQACFVNRVAAALRPGGRFIFASCYPLPATSRRFWLAKAFNAGMHVRNLLIRPPFVMFYLTFLIPDASRLLEDTGFSVDVRPSTFPAPLDRLRMVVATKPAHGGDDDPP